MIDCWGFLFIPPGALARQRGDKIWVRPKAEGEALAGGKALCAGFEPQAAATLLGRVMTFIKKES